MNEDAGMILVPAHEMQERLAAILVQQGFTEERALQCARVFTNNSVDGIATHGINRFPRFVEYIKRGFIHIHAVPELQHKIGGLEQWNGNLGPGILNAMFATEQAMDLAKQNGIGCVALNHTNHWMRGGAYGWQAALKGFVFIGFTNTIANMPAWGARDARLGNNPLVIALPYEEEAIVLDMAMSQFSFGAMELAAMKGEPLPVQGGFNQEGILTDNPSEIIASRRPLPVGYWKGAGLALLLDLLATVLSGGLSTHELSKSEAEYGLSQVFIAIDISKLNSQSLIYTAINNIISNYHQSVRENESGKILYPGERVLETRKTNLLHGIPVMKKVWNEALAL